MALRQHLARLLLLVGLSAVVQGWVIAHAVVPAQDAVRYLAGAQNMQRDGLWPAVLVATDPPLFPTLVYGVHEVYQAVAGNSGETSLRLHWLLSLQGTSAALVVLSLVPLYALLVRWVGTREAFCGGFLFCVVTSAARLGADGLSDSLQLFTVLTAYCALAFLLSNSPQRSRAVAPLGAAAAGLALGFGMLAGTMSLAFALALAVTLVIDQFRNESQLGFAQKFLPSIALVSGVGSIIAPYLLATAGFDQQKIISRWRGEHRPQTAAHLNFPTATINVPSTSAKEASADSWRLKNGEPMAFGHKEASVSLRSRGLFSALAQFAVEFSRLGGAALLVLAAIGYWQTPRPWASRIDRTLVCLTAVYSLIAVVHAARSGYLSDRHLLPLLPLVLAWAARGVIACGVLCERQLPWGEAWADAWPRVPAATWFARCTLLCATIVCLATTARPLHASRWEHRQAAEWLAARGSDSETVLDTRGWTAFFSGCPTYRHEAAAAALANPQLAYVVVEERELAVDTPRSRTLRELLGQSADRVLSISAPGRSGTAGVVIYRWHPERFAMQISATPSSHQ